MLVGHLGHHGAHVLALGQGVGIGVDELQEGAAARLVRSEGGDVDVGNFDRIDDGDGETGVELAQALDGPEKAFGVKTTGEMPDWGGNIF